MEIDSGLVTGSLQVIGNSTMTGSLSVTGDINGSLKGNADSATTASYAVTASYLEGYISPFPFTGSATITGSLEVDGPITATSFIKEGGTSSEYLMADGSTSEGGTGGGGEPSARVEENFVATAGQTVFPITYEIDQIDVYFNGLKLYPDEYTATNGTSVVLAEAATLGSQVSIVKYVSATTSTAVRNEVVFEATANQNTFLVNYTVGQVDVFHNGAKLNPEEFTATNGTSVILGFDCLEGASVTMLVYLSAVSGASGTANYVTKFTGAATMEDSQIYDDGTDIGIGKDSPNAKLDIYGNTIITGSLNVTEGIIGALFGTASNAVSTSFATNATSSSYALSASYSSNVSGTANYIPKFTGTSTIGDSVIFQSGSSIGIGTTSPVFPLHLYKASSDVLLALQKGSNLGYVFCDGTNIGLASDLGSTGYKFLVNRTAPDSAMIINSSGNIGIGTTNASVRTTVRASDASTQPTLGTASGHFLIGNGASNVDYGLMFGVNGDGNTWIQSQRVDSVATAYNILLQPRGGNVGIGTATPTDQLHLSKGGSTYISIDNTGSDYKTLIGTTGSGTKFYSRVLSTSGAAPMDFVVGSDSAMYINASKYVGIGVTNPSGRLHIETIDSSVRIGRTAGLPTIKAITGYDGNMIIDADGSGAVYLNHYQNGNVYLGTGGGKVGIGTSSPGEKFSVDASSSTWGSIIRNNSKSLVALSHGLGYGMAIDSAANTWGVYTFKVAGGDGTNVGTVEYFKISGTGALYSLTTYNNTSSGGANMYIASDGAIVRSTSSLKYKKNVENYEKGLNEIMQMRPVTYNSINESEDGIQYAGLIAEEIHDLGLNEFVQYASDGTPDALSYTNMIALLVKGMQELKAEIEILKNK